MAIDWGTRRIGVAVSDPGQSLAQPVITLTRRRGRRFPMKRLRQVIEEYDPSGVLVGLPLESGGSEGDPARAARELGRSIADATGLPVGYWDERMTTARVLGAVRDQGGGMRGRKEEVDRLAATTLLQAFLDYRRPR